MLPVSFGSSGSAISYDETVIVQFAHRLYRRAASIVASHVVLGGVLAALASAVTALTSQRVDELFGLPVIVIGAIGGLLGWLVGSERAFALRLIAQTALCQVQIERNTRPADAAAQSLPFAVGNAGAYPLPVTAEHHADG